MGHPGGNKALNFGPEIIAIDSTANVLLHVASAHYCGRGALVGISPDGEDLRFVPLRCGSWSCPHCARTNARAWRFLILAGNPTRWMTLTLNPKLDIDRYDALDRLRKAWHKLVRSIRATYGVFEFVSILELHKSGRPHLHVAFRGSYIPQRWLSMQWLKFAYSKIVDIRAIPSKRALARYLTKYLIKQAHRTALTFFRRRIVSRSRNFVTPQPERKGENPYADWQWCHVAVTADKLAHVLNYNYHCPLGETDVDDVFTIGPGALPARSPPGDLALSTLHNFLKDFTSWKRPPTKPKRSTLRSQRSADSLPFRPPVNAASVNAADPGSPRLSPV